MTTPAKTPWYRQFWPWFVIALPASAVVAGLTTVAIAVKHQDSLVHDDWYKEGKAINQDLARDTHARRYGLSARVHSDAVTGEVRVDLQAAAAGFTPPVRLVLYFSHPTRASADQTVVLVRRQGRYHGQLPRALQGRYYVELGAPDWRLLGTQDFPQAEFALTHD